MPASKNNLLCLVSSANAKKLAFKMFTSIVYQSDIFHIASRNPKFETTKVSNLYDLFMSFMLCSTARMAAAIISPEKAIPMSPSKLATNRPKGV